MMRGEIKRLLHRTGALRMLARRNPRRVMILLYHGIRGEDGGPLRQEGDEKFTPVDLFERQIRVCRSYGTVIPLSAAVSGGPLPPNPVVLTFDDGYRNNRTLAFPLLRKYGVPATVFLTTGFLDGQSPLWMDWLDRLVDKGPAGVWEAQLGGEPATLDLRDAVSRMGTRDEVRKRLKQVPGDEIRRFLVFLQGRLGVPCDRDGIPEPLCPLHWDQVREMERSGLVEFGAHTVTHPVLSRCDHAVQEREILDSKRRIEEELGRPCVAFAYPNGREGDYTLETVEILRGCGIEAALTTERGFLHPPAQDFLRLPRWGAPGTEEDLAYLLSR